MKQELTSWIFQQLSVEISFTLAGADLGLLNERTARLHAWRSH